MFTSVEDYNGNFKLEICRNRKEVFFDRRTETPTKNLEYCGRICFLKNFFFPLQHFEERIGPVIPVIIYSIKTTSLGCFARWHEWYSEAIDICFKCIHLLKQFLLLTPNSESRDYFPGDLSALSLSIFAFPFHRFTSPPCAAVHDIFVFFVPCTDQFRSISRLELAISSSERAAVCNSAHVHISVSNIETKGGGITANHRCSNLVSIPIQEEAYRQICHCACSRHIAVSHRKWLHTELLPFSWSKAPCRLLHGTFLLFLLLSSVVLPGADCTPSASPTNSSFPAVSLATSTLFAEELFCDNYRWESLLDDTEKRDCLLNRSVLTAPHCDAIIEKIKGIDNQARMETQPFLDTVRKYATAETYSVQWSMTCCKAAYKNWICSYYFRSHYNGTDDIEGVRNHSYYCKCVERACPFFRVHYDTKLYGGQPTFLCQGFQEDYDTSSEECLDVSESSCKPLHRHSDFVGHKDDVQNSVGPWTAKWTTSSNVSDVTTNPVSTVPAVSHAATSSSSRVRCSWVQLASLTLLYDVFWCR